MPTVAITDYSFPDLELERAILSAAGFELRSGNDKQIPALKSLVAEADAVITQFAPINSEVIGAMQRAKVIVRYGIGFDTFVPTEVVRNAGCEPVSLDDLLAQSDIVTLHCPSTPQTKKLLNATSIARLKPGSVVINLARGDLVDTAALVAALQSGHLAGAAIDVCDPEPIPTDSPLRSLPNVIVASHIASASPKAVRTLRETAAHIALMALRGEPLPNVVNK